MYREVLQPKRWLDFLYRIDILQLVNMGFKLTSAIAILIVSLVGSEEMLYFWVGSSHVPVPAAFFFPQVILYIFFLFLLLIYGGLGVFWVGVLV